jgi:fimbrial isopeptide formation D2 family protein
MLIGLTTALAQTLGGTVIVNEASVSYSVLGLDEEVTSNEVESTVPSYCTFAVTPNGAVANPAHVADAVAGTTLYFPYTLEYTGNLMTDIELTALVDGSSTLLPDSVSVILDSNDNQRFDAGETVITSLNNVALASSTALLLGVTLQPDYPSGGTVNVNLRANCLGEALFDEDNLARVNVLEGGVIDLIKTSVPPSNSLVESGDDITYSISFTVNEVSLSNVVISDDLADELAAPTALSVTVNGFTRLGVASYDNGVVTATLGTLNPGDAVVLTVATSVRAGTPGAVVIDNQATLSFTGGSLDTNTVTHVTPATCAAVIKPDGSMSEPAFTETASPGETVVFPYSLTNLGNVTNDFLLETALTGDAIRPALSLVLDANNNGLVDAGEASLTQLDDLLSGETVNLLLVTEVPRDAALSGDSFVNLIGRCALEPSIADDDNISEVGVPLGGITGLLKSAEPSEGTTLYPGASLSYFITFKANGRELRDVVITDRLDERLAVPTSFTNGELRDAETGLTATVVGSYDAATRTLTWNLATVPADMNVRLEVVTAVKADLQPENGGTISNQATFSSSDTEASTNTVTHPLNNLEILLQKTADPERVFVGDTLYYTLTILNPEDSITLRELVLTDTLPGELRYQPGTARVTLPGQPEQRLEPTVNGQTLTWTLPGIKTNEQIVVLFGTEVLAAAVQTEELVNTAEVVASDATGRAVADAAASATTPIDKGLFTAPAVLLGTVFEDLNGNGLYDQDSDVPVQGVRLYLSDGRSVVSDHLGRYTFLELGAGTEVVKVDVTTLPARLLAETKSEARPGLWRVRLEEGLITRQDVPLLPPGARIAISQSLNVVMGSVRVQKRVVVAESATTVVLTVTSGEALKGLTLQDVLPPDVTVSKAISDDGNAVLNGLTFVLGNVPSGYASTIQYTVEPKDITPTALLLAPTVVWQVRP